MWRMTWQALSVIPLGVYNVEDDVAGIVCQARGSTIWRMTWQALCVRTEVLQRGG
jgi:hypothetical protein